VRGGKTLWGGKCRQMKSLHWGEGEKLVREVDPGLGRGAMSICRKSEFG